MSGRAFSLCTLCPQGDGVVSLHEFLDFFAQLSGNLSDREFAPVFQVLLKTARRGQRYVMATACRAVRFLSSPGPLVSPITWPMWAFYAFGAIAVLQLIVRGVLVGLTIDQWSIWDDFDDQAGVARNSSVLRLVACIVGLLLSLVGVLFFFSPPHKKAKRLTVFGYAGIVLALLFLVSGVMDGTTPALSALHGGFVQ